jgi:hypothetical protein
MQCLYSFILHSSGHSIRRRVVQIKFIMTIAIAVIMCFVDCIRLDVQTHTPLNDVYPDAAVFFTFLLYEIFHCFKH